MRKDRVKKKVVPGEAKDDEHATLFDGIMTCVVTSNKTLQNCYGDKTIIVICNLIFMGSI